jgi:hypothetical protein
MNLGFYQDYDKRKHKDLRQYKVDFLKTIIVDDKLYKFIAFDDDSYLNQIKLQCLKKGQLWFSYYKFLNDKTEFDMKYDAKRVSYKTGIPCDNIRFFVATMKEIYDVCSLTYSYDGYMWKAYSNNSNGVCLVFNVIDYDMLYPVEYVDKDDVDYTEMLIEAYNSTPKELFDNGILMAELPYVIKNPDNESMKSYLEKEVRILSDPFGDGILNSGNVYPGVKNDFDYKGRNLSYDKCGLSLDKIIIGEKCDNTLIDCIRNVSMETDIIFQR